MRTTSAPHGRMGAGALLGAIGLMAGALLLVGGSPALAADPTISINPGNVPTTAAGFSSHECDDNLGGGPFQNQDVWVFVLPGSHPPAEEFGSLHLTFSTPGGIRTANITGTPTSTSAIANNMGTSKAWIRLPAGWTLTAGSAAVTGDDDRHFELSHTCPASGEKPNPKLALTKTGTPTSDLDAGDRVTYTYTVKNESTGTSTPITRIAVTDDKVTGITCQAGSLAPGKSTTCTGTYTVTTGDVAEGEIVNTARATGRFGKETVTSNPARFTVHTESVRASLSIDEKARVEGESECRDKCADDGFAEKGDKIFYTFRVTNTGTVKLTHVKVDDPHAGQVVCDRTTLAPGAGTDCHAVKPYVVTEADVKRGKVVDTSRAIGEFDHRTVVSAPDTVTICIRGGKFDHRKHEGHEGGEGRLPTTGSNLAQTFGVAGSLLAAGSLLVGLSRLRRKARIRL
ncbi:DUF7507 domain-containing protein [Micromonospora eburnea]|uniref:Conserved repeat domain-containing protein n=1 Tax=Micromonospora eburnea TaxID=227316 RepID=A0A1C6VJR8_9ACTN|nr:DUF11 domain-containing protein [Micromonospora eburnea]SCL66563.1 conserved repeat domain-containing protein [Micromonospora eburnea]